VPQLTFVQSAKPKPLSVGKNAKSSKKSATKKKPIKYSSSEEDEEEEVESFSVTLISHNL